MPAPESVHPENARYLSNQAVFLTPSSAAAVPSAPLLRLQSFGDVTFSSQPVEKLDLRD